MARQPTTEDWPVSEDQMRIVEHDTLVGEPPPAPFAPPPDRRIGAGMLLALAVLALVAAGIAVAWLLTHGRSTAQPTTVVVTTRSRRPAAVPGKVNVPRLVGLTAPAAVIRLERLGLRAKVLRRPAKKARGIVLSQRPGEATRLRKGALVTLLVAAGKPQAAVPDLRGTKIAQARLRLSELGFGVTTTGVTSNEPAGTVVDEAPRPGVQLPKGSLVTLSVVVTQKQGATTSPATSTAPTTPTTTAASSTAPTTTAATTTAAAPPHPQNATVPDVGGETEAAAVEAYGRAGVLPILFFVPSQEPLGTVVAQAKAAGTVVPYHAHSQINVSQGPGEKQKEQVPDVVGKSLPDALRAINGASLRLIYLKLPVTSRAQAGKIVLQSPGAGAQAPQNAQVLVFLGAYKG